MDAFKWISVVLSMILGLGVTRLLAATVAVFRSRKRARLDWVPLAWAGCIFLWQLQYWWAIIELPGMIQHWTIGSFLMLVSLKNVPGTVVDVLTTHRGDRGPHRSPKLSMTAPSTAFTIARKPSSSIRFAAARLTSRLTVSTYLSSARATSFTWNP